MNYRCLQFFFAANFFLLVASRAADLERGKVYQGSFTDVEGRQFALGDGHAILLTVATRETETKAHLVGHNVPDEFIGHPHYRCVTIINFQNKIPLLLRGIITAAVRHVFRAEADAVQPRYSAKKIEHSPRADLYAVADFDGATVRQLDMDPASNDLAVFVFDGHGTLVRQWNDLPSSEELRAALEAARP
jgi:hypothetical protein